MKKEMESKKRKRISKCCFQRFAPILNSTLLLIDGVGLISLLEFLGKSSSFILLLHGSFSPSEY